MPKLLSILKDPNPPALLSSAVSSLTKIDEAVLADGDIKNLSAKLVKILVDEFKSLGLAYQAAAIFLLDEEEGKLSLVAKEGYANLPDNVEVSTTDSLNILPLSLKENRAYMATPSEISRDIGDLTCNLVFPMYAGKLPLGVLLLSSSETKESISEFESLILRSLIASIEIAVNHAKAMSYKNEFLSLTAHELRSPMTAIKGYLSMIKEGDAGEISDTAKRYLQSAMDGNSRLISLVNNILNISKIEEGRLTFDIQDVSLSKLVASIFEEHQASVDGKGLAYSLDIQDGIKDIVAVDEDRIYEVLSNLVDNSIKYTEKGQVIVRLFNPNPQTLRFEIVDTGAGVEKEEQKSLFNKFYRAESGRMKASGTGLGLYVSKLLVNKFGGKIGMDSAPGSGSTFWFELPLKT